MARNSPAPEAYAAFAARLLRHRHASDAAGRLELFRDRIHDYNGVLHTCERGSVAATIASALQAHGKTRLVVPADFPETSLPKGFAFTWDHNLSYDEIDRCEGVITGCTVAIALTGTIVLQDGLYQGRRALTLIPDYHLCLVGQEQLFETVPEAVRVLANTGARVTTFVSETFSHIRHRNDAGERRSRPAHAGSDRHSLTSAR